jgi:hypothetical protein
MQTFFYDFHKLTIPLSDKTAMILEKGWCANEMTSDSEILRVDCVVSCSELKVCSVLSSVTAYTKSPFEETVAPTISAGGPVIVFVPTRKLFIT